MQATTQITWTDVETTQDWGGLQDAEESIGEIYVSGMCVGLLLLCRSTYGGLALFGAIGPLGDDMIAETSGAYLGDGREWAEGVIGCRMTPGCAEMSQAITKRGDFALGLEEPHDVAQEWIAAGFSAGEAADYLDARCFDAERSAKLRDAGITASDADTSVEYGAGTETLGYLVANGDMTVAEALMAARTISVADSDIRTALSEAGERLRRAQTDRAEAITDITRLASQAQEAGVSIAEIARLAAVTRQTVYSLIRGRV